MHRSLTRAFVEGDDALPSRFLWRLDSVDVARTEAVLLVQSDQPGHWGSLPAGYILEHLTKDLDLSVLLRGQRLYRFRLLANPTVSREGKRYGLSKEEEQLAWLNRQLDKGGCAMRDVLRTRSERWMLRKKGHLITVQAVGFEGILQLERPASLQSVMVQGIGHAKSLGLGLLSLAPLRHG